MSIKPCIGARRVAAWLEAPMIALAFLWIALTVADMAGYHARWLEWASNGVWLLFVADFALRLGVAKSRLGYLRHNWITVLSPLLPALRILRIARLLRMARGVRLFRVYASTNRGIRALARALGRKGFGYVVAMTLVITYLGAAGMYALEDGLYRSYWDAVWWTAMIMTTMGSEAWPRTGLGRLLCLALSLYAFSIFGYVTATLASFLVEREARDGRD